MRTLLLLALLAAAPALAQPVAPLYAAARSGGASAADAARLAVAVRLAGQEAKLVPAFGDGRPSDQFGYAVSLSGDRALIGAASNSTAGVETGSAYVYVRSGTAWTLEAKLLPADGAAGDDFGISVSLDGDRALVGARYHDGRADASGSAYVFVRSGTTWTQEARLAATDGALADQLGISVSLDGDRALVGAEMTDTDNALSTGSAYVFVRSGTTWTQEAKLTAADSAPFGVGTGLGRSVSLSGDRALVGIVGNSFVSPGVYVFVRSGATWTLETKIVPADVPGSQNFGRSVSLDGDRALIGAAGPANRTSNGAAYVFVRSGTTWIQEASLVASDGAVGDFFGCAVSLSGDRALIGAREDDDRARDNGSAYVFVRSGTTWTQETKIVPADGGELDFFGGAVSLQSGRALIGAYNDDNPQVSNSGSAYVFSGIAPVAGEAAPEAGALALSVTPNPATGPAALRLSLAAAAETRAVVVDALGRTVAVLHDGPLGAGPHALPMPSGLAPGVYLVRVAAGAAAASARFTVAR